ncbi:MAG: ester cyclase [Saprospiraceae bacterium]
MSNQNEQLTRDLHDSFSNNQFDKTMELVSDNVHVNAFAFGMSFNSKQGFGDFMQTFKSAFPDITIKHTNIVSNGNMVAVEFTARGTHNGPLQTPAGAIPPTGKTVDFNVAEFYIWENGKVVSMNNYQDAGSIMRQIGVM